MKPREKTFMKIVLACVLVSWGPGYAVANKPVFLGPIPLPYAWTVFWFLIFFGAIVYAFRYIWIDEE